MTQSIITNRPSNTARRFITNNSKALEKKQQTLASGSLIADPSNAPSNAGIAQRMEAQQRGSAAAASNTAQAETMLQLAAGTMSNILEQAQRMRSIAVMASNGLYTATDLVTLNQEFNGLYQEMGREIASTSFNGIQILNQFSTNLQIGPNNDNDNKISIQAGDMDIQTPYGSITSSELDTTTPANNADIITQLDSFINGVSSAIGSTGAQKSKMDIIAKTLSIFMENNAAAKSVIADADIPEELAQAQSLQSLVDVSSTILRTTSENSKRLADLVQAALR
ncbi:MAG: flagellin [Proteobacteria bacterium]|nr:flagellin [Pseudomonadota bacterium]